MGSSQRRSTRHSHASYATGYDVDVRSPEGGPERRHVGRDAFTNAADVAVYFGEAISACALAELGAMLVRSLARRVEARAHHSPPRRAVIYGPNGGVLREVELPDEVYET